jgi:hypothetical protein
MLLHQRLSQPLSRFLPQGATHRDAKKAMSSSKLLQKLISLWELLLSEQKGAYSHMVMPRAGGPSPAVPRVPGITI